ncbi:metallothionein-like protein type 2 [Rhodamnia argentea]|uniref:Metallothionein-like protein n=1 Tax=Rhodamnia argentea TaxID=178133 RepID=A0A8B8NPU5_9MYRT|nr:metallothionein-like protein type 2 [Rhodamnia argentea]
MLSTFQRNHPKRLLNMSCCGGKCGCGSGCKCGSGCSGCGMHPDVAENSLETIISGVTPVKMCHEVSEMSSFGAENGGCKCGSNCSCDPCKC